MSQHRAYPRTPFERHGIIGGRLPELTGHKPPRARDDLPFDDEEMVFNPVIRAPSDRDKTPRHVKESIKPNCVVMATKRIGFGATEMKMSQSMSLSASDLLILHTTRPDQLRYRVNIYLKPKR